MATHSSDGERTSTFQESAALNILALLAKELPKLVNSSERPSTATTNEVVEAGSKRRRLSSNHPSHTATTVVDHTSCQLPDEESMEAIIAAYFEHVHPWIPMVHQARFRSRLNSSERPKLEVILHAMTIAASKFVQTITLPFDSIKRIRTWVVMEAMDRISLESLQALTILAFTDIGNGNGASVWSIIGSLTRTVGYSQLTQESQGQSTHQFCRPFELLEESDDWTEIEERRRVFWNVFNLDRFCSISMGWNTSLTSDDVHRRLPCDGHLWRKRTPVVTPYFGIWDKSAGRIGNPIAFLPHYHSPEQTVNEATIQSPSDASPGATHNITATDMSTVGAFAYCIEATESMSRIISYFLQQKLNLFDHHDISSWLTRFKELDLRLVHWKMLLPQKWKTNMERPQSTLMDPNLTTAHVTHNASMILLHQLIAYPPEHWGFRSRLPSTCSVEACYTASIEIARITHNYLENSNEHSPIGIQYTFCIFIAARVLLIHWRYLGHDTVAEEFWSLVASLEEISKRWSSFSEPAQKDLATQYANCLKGLHTRCTHDASFRINVMDYAIEADHYSTFRPQEPHLQSPTAITFPRRGHVDPLQSGWSYGIAQMQGTSVQFSPRASIGQHLQTQPTLDHVVSDALANGLEASNDFATIPQMMLDPNFMNMDRVITYDDGAMFAATLDNGQW